ncbi:TPA: hypothetical protein EYP13_03780 [Candidatus Micrarchaeota archaeon]|nr:hypothetical protein [Candidatus Micrarchaeota archaeon]
MRKLVLEAFLLVLGVASAWGMDLLVTDFVPSPGDTIAIWVAGAPDGAEFHWDLNGDGTPEKTTTESRIEWAVPEGAHRVVVSVVLGGKTISTFRAVIVCDHRFGAFQTVMREKDYFIVTVVFRAKAILRAPGLSLKTPTGWGTEMIDPGTMVYRMRAGIEGFWSLELYPGDELTITYRLLPLAKGMAFTFSGTASAFVEGEGYVELPVAGLVTPYWP